MLFLVPLDTFLCSLSKVVFDIGSLGTLKTPFKGDAWYKNRDDHEIILRCLPVMILLQTI